jgi:hypothetical protein
MDFPRLISFIIAMMGEAFSFHRWGIAELVIFPGLGAND